MSTNYSNAAGTYLSRPMAAAYPFTQLAWLYPTVNANARLPIGCHDGAVAHFVGLNGADWIFSGGTSNTVITSGTTNGWVFVILRWIASGNFRAALLLPDGSIAHAQNTDVSAATNFTTLILGAYPLFPSVHNYDGLIWGYTEIHADVQPDGDVLNNNSARQLAYRGPFSIPRIAKDIIEYRSFRSRVVQNDPAEVYYRRDKGAQIWTNNNGVLGGYPKPPQASGWIEPWNTSRVLPVYVPNTPISPPASSTSWHGTRRRRRAFTA